MIESIEIAIIEVKQLVPIQQGLIGLYSLCLDIVSYTKLEWGCPQAEILIDNQAIFIMKRYYSLR